MTSKKLSTLLVFATIAVLSAQEKTSLSANTEQVLTSLNMHYLKAIRKRYPKRYPVAPKTNKDFVAPDTSLFEEEKKKKQKTKTDGPDKFADNGKLSKAQIKSSFTVPRRFRRYQFMGKMSIMLQNKEPVYC